MVWTKRLSAPNWWPIERKTSKFMSSPRGSHKDSIALAVVMRDIFKLVSNAKEAKSVIKSGKIEVDGRLVKDHRFGIGSMDVIKVKDVGKNWRALPVSGLKFVEISDDEAKFKLCRIKNKTTVAGGKTQVNMHDGKNILYDNDCRTNDTAVVEFPNKIKEILKFEEGALVLITSGKFGGKIAKINKIDKGNKRVWLEEEGKLFEALINSVFVVGKGKPMIKLG